MRLFETNVIAKFLDYNWESYFTDKKHLQLILTSHKEWSGYKHGH